MFIFVKTVENENQKVFNLSTLKSMKNVEKVRVFHRVIHIIHTKTYVFGELLETEKRTNVLVSCYENVKLSKKIGLIIDF